MPRHRGNEEVLRFKSEDDLELMRRYSLPRVLNVLFRALRASHFCHCHKSNQKV